MIKLLVRSLIALIFATAFYSCNDEPGFIGSEFLSRNDSLVSYTDSASYITLMKDDFDGDSAVFIALGSLSDSKFGTFESSMLTDFVPSVNDSGDFSSFIADSLKLRLYIAYNGGDTNSSFSVSVYRLIKPLTGDVSMGEDFNNYIDPTPINLGQAPTNIDSLSSYIEIPLDPNYAQNYLIPAKMTSDSSFLSTVFGFGIKVDNFSSPEGLLFSVDYNSSYTNGLTISYHKPNQDTIIQKFYYHISSSSNRAALISHDYSGTNFSAAINDSNAINDSGYIQSLNGVFSKINFMNSHLWPQTELINKASLSFSFVEDSLNPIIRHVGAYYKDEFGNYRFVTDNPVDYGDNYYGGIPSNGKVYINLTQHLKNIAQGIIKDKSIYLLPVNYGDEIVYYDNLVYGRMVIDASSVKLNIIYSKLND